MYDNIPSRFVPDEHVPEQLFANPRINTLAHNRSELNATAELFDRGLAEHADWTALRSLDTGGTVTYRELGQEIDALAGGLRDLGVGPGDRVCLRLPEVPAAVAAAFAVWRLGAVFVPCPMAARAKEIGYYLADTEASVLVTDDEGLDEVEAALDGPPPLDGARPSVKEVVVRGDPGSLGRPLSTLRSGPTVTEPADTAPFDAASVFYTGGTTGRPKGCLHSHVAEVAITLLECEEGRAMGPADTLFCPAPIGHSLGSGEMINFPFRFGADVVLTHRAAPARMVEVIEEQGVTVFVGSPTMLRMMMDATDLPSRDLSSLRLVVVGGENFDRDTFEAWTEQSGIEPCNTVGMSQLRHWFLTAYRDSEKFAPGLSVGKAYAGFETKLVDVERPERDLEDRDRIGRLAVRGPTNITYWNNIHPEMPGAMADYSVGDWGLADDAYRQDEAGFLYFETRLDNMIVSAGRQISGPEVEDTLGRHGSVAAVAVVASPDETRGEAVKAFVVPAPDATPGDALADRLQSFVKAEIAPYKYPREVEFVEELPTDEMGKIQRAQLRERERSG